MKHLIAFLLLFSGIYCYSQSDSLVSYKDMVINADNLYAISDNGKLAVWNLNTLEKQIIDTDTVTYTAISKDRNGVIHLGSKTGFLATFDPNTFQVRIVSKLKVKHSKQVYNIFFNSDNKMFVVVEPGIYDPVNNKLWSDFKIKPVSGVGYASAPKRFLFFNYSKKPKYFFRIPTYTFIDSANRIWLATYRGEFGTILNVFDADNEKEINKYYFENYGLIGVRSFFEDNEHNVYITSCIQHFSNYGSIYKITGSKSIKIFDTHDYGGNLPEENMFIGPGAFSLKENKLYFSTQLGVYRTAVPHENQIKDFELVFLTEHKNIIKMEFTRDNRLIYLTSINGIGIYDGNKNVMLK
ncbi:hypothetical protein [Flavobacterium beibuense]|uniref:WD40 repeat domain-containing protein n=1 Tax=Flavobacterium beibuense TaxID=657326 RepID=A0A444WFE8_9FLAO|nr:hypothetical protein [Flavobacterium beibuense]RYJ44549.1 hypothetical protein NU09_1159 [Flavobacterium beibuense]